MWQPQTTPTNKAVARSEGLSVKCDQKSTLLKAGPRGISPGLGAAGPAADPPTAFLSANAKPPRLRIHSATGQRGCSPRLPFLVLTRRRAGGRHSCGQLPLAPPAPAGSRPVRAVRFCSSAAPWFGPAPDHSHPTRSAAAEKEKGGRRPALDGDYSVGTGPVVFLRHLAQVSISIGRPPPHPHRAV